MRLRIPGDIVSYAGREREKYNQAMGTYGQPSPEELALMEEQVKAVKQALEDRRATRDLILGQMGYKLGTDEQGNKTLVPLTKEERLAMMSEADKSRSAAAGSYAERAKAAYSGTTKLPSFLKSNIDLQKTKEEALLGEMLGPEFMNSTAGKQALAELKSKEENIRQGLQDQDIAFAPTASQALSSQLANRRQGLIGAYESLPNVNSGLIQGRGGLLQQMQQTRLDALNKRFAELEDKRQRITSIMTLGGTVGGAAMSAANARKTTPAVSTYSPSLSYVPNTDFYDTSQLGLSYGGY